MRARSSASTQTSRKNGQNRPQSTLVPRLFTATLFLISFLLFTTPSHAQTCGDGVTDSGESCDDGNTTSSDGCDSSCQLECGNGVVDSGESCDDGNTTSSDGCNSSCQLECGDGYLQGSEQCDDGNTADGDYCTPICTNPACGDSYLSDGEGCDDGNTTSSDGCSDTCLGESGFLCQTPGSPCCVDSNGDMACDCGDSSVQMGEGCDDGNATPGDGCSDVCQVEGGYYCEIPGSACCEDLNSNYQCDYCGDGYVGTGETCDDGNVLPGDGCNGSCQVESGINCGNGALDAEELCDDGNVTPGDGCSGSCEVESGFYCPTPGFGCCPDANQDSACDYCGDGVVSGGEQCDDEGTTNGDGCNSFCELQGYCGDGSVSTSWFARETTRTWVSVTSSADGLKLAAVANHGTLVTSSDSGFTWTLRDASSDWRDITSSSDGTKLAAVGDYRHIYTSTDSGVTWTAREPDGGWRSITSSQNGTTIAATPLTQGQIYVSTDGGDTWTARESNRIWSSITCSADGTILAATVGGGHIYISTDSGVTWNARAISANWTSIASSSDGMRLAAAVNGGHLYTSTDGGLTWTPRESSRNWAAISSSADGMTLAAVGGMEKIYISTNGGVTWKARDSVREWSAITISSDGTKLAATDYNGTIHTSLEGGYQDECDDGNTSDGDTCTSICTTPVCGDGYVSSDETCDDGNTVGTDGCSAVCAVETGYSCSGTPSVCDVIRTATPTATYTGTPTPTFTPTHIPTSTFTPTATAIATPTSVPINTPTPPLPTVPPPLLAEPGIVGNGPILGSGTFTLGGAGSPGSIIEVSVDEVVVGTSQVNAQSLWSFNLPPLAIGRRSITAVSVDSEGVRSSPSAPLLLTVLSSSPLDFIGAGDTAVTVSRTSGKTVRYKTRRVSSERWTLYEVPGRYAVPGDYDGDGVTDIAAVEERAGKLIWNVRSSISGNSSSIELGSRGDVILGGCKLLSSEKISAVVFRRQTRKLYVRDTGAGSKNRSAVLPVGKGDLLGCGDTDGDGIDEILFKVPASDGPDAIAAFTSTGLRTMLTDMTEFSRGLVVRRSDTEVPLVALVHGESRKGIPVRLESLAGSFSFPMFYVDRDSTIGTGYFSNRDGEQSAGLLWSQNDTRTVFRRLLKPNSQPERLFKMPHGYRLTRVQNIYRTR